MSEEARIPAQKSGFTFLGHTPLAVSTLAYLQCVCFCVCAEFKDSCCEPAIVTCPAYRQEDWSWDWTCCLVSAQTYFYLSGAGCFCSDILSGRFLILFFKLTSDVAGPGQWNFLLILPLCANITAVVEVVSGQKWLLCSILWITNTIPPCSVLSALSW